MLGYGAGEGFSAVRRFVQVLSFDIVAKAVLGLVAVALIRFMPTEQFAAYTLALAVATLTAQILAGGFNRIYIVGYDRLALAGHVEPFLGLQLALIAVAGVLGVPAAAAFRGLYPAVVALAAAVVLSEFSKTYFQRELRFGRYSAIEIGRVVAQAVAIVALIAMYGRSVQAGAVLWIQAAALAGAFFFALGARLSWRRVPALRVGRALLRGVVAGPYGYLFGYFGVLAVFSQTDVILLKILSDERTLASYGSALRYYALLSLALSAVHAVLLPSIQRAETREALDTLYTQHQHLLVVFIPAVALGALAAGWVLPWIDLGRYPDAVPTFRILAVSAVLSFAFSPHVNLLMKHERFRFLFILIVFALVVHVLLCLLLITRFGAPGAAAATLVGSACVTVPIYFESRRLKAAAS
jgi:O-antigen/teichoic acid export membrane protein